eukprot:356737-Chlamydomonas_euryale.AAC.3
MEWRLIHCPRAYCPQPARVKDNLHCKALQCIVTNMRSVSSQHTSNNCVCLVHTNTAFQSPDFCNTLPPTGSRARCRRAAQVLPGATLVLLHHQLAADLWRHSTGAAKRPVVLWRDAKVKVEPLMNLPCL